MINKKIITKQYRHINKGKEKKDTKQKRNRHNNFNKDKKRNR